MSRRKETERQNEAFTQSRRIVLSLLDDCRVYLDAEASGDGRKATSLVARIESIMNKVRGDDRRVEDHDPSADKIRELTQRIAAKEDAMETLQRQVDWLRNVLTVVVGVSISGAILLTFAR